MTKEAQTAEIVLILTPNAGDSAAAVSVLRESGIGAIACRDIRDLCRRLATDHGAAMISEEALVRDESALIQKAVESQEAWSDIPILLLTNADVYRATEVFSKSGNISLLERPFSRLTLIRSVEVALRARRKQYQTRELLMALKTAKDESERANFAKSQFLANMSHEIRTPVGAILGFTELMKNPESTPSDKLKYMGIVERNSRHLLRLIDDILDLSKVESGKMTIERTSVALTDLLADLISVMKFKAQEKGILFETRLKTEIPEFVLSDSVRLRQIISNIVGNAIKFTDHGRVEVEVSYAETLLRFLVHDTGMGIPEERRHKLFQAFSQADSSTTRKFGGTGLGLILSRRLAEAMNGRLELVKSEPKVGTTFLIEVAVDKAEGTKMVGFESVGLFNSAAPLIDNHQVLRGMKILLVEDSPDNQELVQAFLNRTGAQIRVASNGGEGLEAALNEDFDVVLMDIQMPVMDGHEATRRLRQNHYSRPVIALTAHAMVDERKKCFATGFTDFLPKPLQRDALVRVLERYRSSTLSEAVGMPKVP